MGYNNSMEIVLLFPEYVIWHYTTALRLCLNIITNFLWFTVHFFSIPILVRTLFSPWHRLRESYQKGFHPQVFAETLLINTIMRLVGFVIRTVVIIFGSMFCVVVAILGLAVFLLWLALPVIVFLLALKGVHFLIT